MIRFENVSKDYYKKKESVAVLKDINLTINKDEIIGIVGHSGAGKSTLLRIINGLIAPTSGSVCLDNSSILIKKANSLNQIRHQIGMIFQHLI